MYKINAHNISGVRNSVNNSDWRVVMTNYIYMYVCIFYDCFIKGQIFVVEIVSKPTFVIFIHFQLVPWFMTLITSVNIPDTVLLPRLIHKSFPTDLWYEPSAKKRNVAASCRIGILDLDKCYLIVLSTIWNAALFKR